MARRAGVLNSRAANHNSGPNEQQPRDERIIPHSQYRAVGSLQQSQPENAKRCLRLERDGMFAHAFLRAAAADGIRYAFGGNGPLTVAEVADLLEIERDHCYRAFEAFQALVEEQIAAIVAVEGGGQAASGGLAPAPTVTRDFFTFSPETGDIVFRGTKIGSASYADGKTNVAFSIAYESQDEKWILPLSWLGHGLSQAGLDKRPPVVVEMTFDAEDIELVASAGPVMLVEKTLKVDGRSWRFHKSDADHWSSPLHGHDYDHGQVIDGITGAIYDKATRTHIGQLKPKKLDTMHEMLRSSKDLAPLAAQHLPTPLSPPP